DSATTSIQVSVPLANTASGAALHVYHAASAGVDLTLSADAAQFGNGVQLAVDASGSHSFCLPAYMRGGVYTFTATATVPGGAGKCGDPVDLSAFLDNVTVDDQGCAPDPYIADPGFESAGG